MRNPGHLLLRSTLRALGAAALLVPAALVMTGGVASADVSNTQGETAVESFGVLGPVGLVAVALGIVGMTLGVLRQRRKTRAAALATEPAAPVAEPGPVTAMAEAVLADQDNTPTRPFSTQGPHA